MKDSGELLDLVESTVEWMVNLENAMVDKVELLGRAAFDTRLDVYVALEDNDRKAVKHGIRKMVLLAREMRTVVNLLDSHSKDGE